MLDIKRAAQNRAQEVFELAAHKVITRELDADNGYVPAFAEIREEQEAVERLAEAVVQATATRATPAYWIATQVALYLAEQATGDETSAIDLVGLVLQDERLADDGRLEAENPSVATLQADARQANAVRSYWKKWMDNASDERVLRLNRALTELLDDADDVTSMVVSA